MDALGMIETNGLVPAIECADVMLKAARTTLLSQTLTGGGLVTICITGDVGAVQAAVEAGAAAAGEFGRKTLVSQHIIPRPYADIEMIILSEDIKSLCSRNAAESGIEEKSQRIHYPETAMADSTKSERFHIPSFDKNQIMSLQKINIDELVIQYGIDIVSNLLKKMTVSVLRHLIREYSGLGLTGRELYRVSKGTLIQLIIAYYRRDDVAEE